MTAVSSCLRLLSLEKIKRLLFTNGVGTCIMEKLTFVSFLPFFQLFPQLHFFYLFVGQPYYFKCKKGVKDLFQIFCVIENLHTPSTFWLVLSVYRVRLSLEETNICCLNFSRNAIYFNCLSCWQFFEAKYNIAKIWPGWLSHWVQFK